MLLFIILIALMALTAFCIIRAGAQASAQEAKFWLETVEKGEDDRTLVRRTKRGKNENTASKGGGKHDITPRPAKHSRQA